MYSSRKAYINRDKDMQKTPERLVNPKRRDLRKPQGMRKKDRKDPDTKEPSDSSAVLGVILELFSQGVIAVPAGRWGNTLRFMPPLTIKRDHFFTVVEMVVEAVKNHKDALAG